jgi:flagellar motility protein MotE (MotC chaperone)
VEEHTKKLETELENTNKQIESTKIEIQKSTFNNNQSVINYIIEIGAFDSKMVHIYHKMEKLIAIEECD